MINNDDKDITSLLSFPESPSTSSEGCGTNDHFGNSVSIENANSAVEGAHPSGEYKSLRELTSREISYIKDIIASSITCNIGDPYVEHSYSTDICDPPSDTALEMVVAALNFYSIFNGLESLGCTKFLTKSKLPASIGLGTFGTKRVKLLTSSAMYLPPEHKSHSESTLSGHLQGFGLSLVPIAGDGNCFFTTVAFQLFQLMSTTDVPTQTLNSLSNMGITTSMTISELAAFLRKLLVEEWIGERIDDYVNFVPNSVDFLSEAKQFEQPGYHHGPLGDLIPMAMANILHLSLAIVTSEAHTLLISVCPSGNLISYLPLLLGYNSFGDGHYDAAAFVTDVSSGNYSEMKINHKLSLTV